MPRRALYDKRPFLLAAIAAALAFYYLRSGPWPEMWFIPLKGAASVLLALYAWLRHSSQDAKLLALMMLIAAAGDMAMEIHVEAGHLLYFGYFVVALMLYLRHRREDLSQSQKYAFAALLLLPPLILYLFAGPQANIAITAFGLAAGAMAAGAWASAFPRYRVGAGAGLILAASLLFFAGQGLLQGDNWPQVFIWPLTFLGHFLVCTGVVQTLRKRDPELRVVAGRRAE